MHQLPRQMATYVYQEKPLSHQQKVANIGFVWHTDTLFQTNDILV